MSTTTKNIGFVPVNRGEFDTTGETRYYKDNIVQYKGCSFIAFPEGYEQDHSAYVTSAPFDKDPKSPNKGWKVFVLGVYDDVLVKAETSGSSTNRPASADIYIGFIYFDTTIGKPIWWNGSKWADEGGFTPTIKRGTTAQRPTSTLQATADYDDAGYEYFDTTLGKPIYFKVTAVLHETDEGVDYVKSWVDANGEAV